MQTARHAPPRRAFAVIDGAAPVSPDRRGSTLAIGNFDGVHRGHQALLQAALDDSRDRHAAAGVMVFEPHPRVFFRPDLPHFTLTPRPRQMQLIEVFGLDLAVVLPFDRALSQLSAAAFIEDVLVARLGVAHVVIGYDFSFGRDRAGTPEIMREMGARLGFGVSVIAPVGNGGAVFSSSAVRGLLAQGDVRGANAALGHRWRITGIVTGGAKRGTGLGFPTANIAMPAGANLGHGIYAAWVHVAGERHAGAAYLGTRPQFDNGAPVLEVFLIDFDGDLYGHEISVAFVDFLRKDGAFTGIDALKAQMARDCAQASGMLASVAAADPLAGLPLGAA
jgi:riboflavin kinase / FMN adenylyltransferase